MKFLSDFSGDIRRVKEVTNKEVSLKILLALAGVIFSLNFIIWYLKPDHRGNAIFYWLLFITFLYQIIRYYFEWYYTSIIQLPKKSEIKHKPTVDVLTTYAEGEPKEMVKNTLLAIKKMDYEHETFLCDEVDDSELKAFCKTHGIYHVTRKEKIGAKAGNINNALKNCASGELCLILDPDHVPHSKFIDEVVPYFEEKDVGYVQVAQAFYNQDFTVISKAVAEQTYLFYGPIMLGLNKLGAVPAIGANCIFRRSALDSIGGHATGLTEDMHTSMLLHAKGWKSVYVPSMVAKGLVPWNYSGYCKQQIKWSRGTFDLLLNVYPKVFKSLSVSQRLYYLTAPFFYLYGVKSLIDFFVPILALVLMISPLQINVVEFFIYYIPISFIGLIFRFFNQRWLYEPNEKGLFLLGGILLKSTWWVALLGTIYAFINKSVPYIPTPKNLIRESPWKLLIPNFIVIVISIFAIIYGLRADFQPHSMLMAAFAITNIVLLSVGNLMAMQTLIAGFHQRTQNSFLSKHSAFRLKFWKFRIYLYEKLQYSTVFLFSVLVLSVLVLGYFTSFKFGHSERIKAIYKKDIGKPLYHVTTFSENIQDSDLDFSVLSKYNSDVSLTDLDLVDSPSDTSKILTLIPQIYALGAIPLINIKTDREINVKIINQEFDSVFMKMARLTSAKHLPAYLCISRNSANESIGKYDSLGFKSKFHLAQRYVYDFFKENGLEHVAWINAVNSEDDLQIAEYNKDFVSWLLLGPGLAYVGSDSVKTLTERLSNLEMSLMINQEQVNQAELLPKLLPIEELVKALVVPYSSQKDQKRNTYLSENIVYSYNLAQKVDDKPSTTKTIGKDNSLNKFQSLPYIKGIAYNPASDWQDGRESIILTRKKLERDFSAIKDMGANTIRRYHPSVYDYNIFQVSREKNLKVLYGFWFDPKVDYLKDKKKVENYVSSCIDVVKNLKHQENIIAWVIGNETWGLSKHHYQEPYLTLLRNAYVRMVEEIAYKIRLEDPERIVMTASEHSSQLATELRSFFQMAPSIDAIGINSYYDENLSSLVKQIEQFFPNKPYLVSEFGPNGYWYETYTEYNYDSILYENTSYGKAKLYSKNWINYVQANKDLNMGGVAFCWQDRYDGTATWFGLTDLEENKKPAYYELSRIWSDNDTEFPIPDFQIVGPEGLLTPGWPYYFTAANLESIDLTEADLEYKWMVYEEKSFKKILETNYKKMNKRFEYTMPDNPSSYRLYLYVKDKKGHVVTASRGLPIDWSRLL